MKKAIILSKFIPVLFITSLIFLLFSFIYSSLKTSALQDLEEEKQLFEVSEKRFAAIRKDMKDWENVEKEYLEFKDDLIIRFEDFSKFRKNLELLISRNSLSKSNFRVEYKNALKDEFIKVKIYMKLEGNYRSFKKFIYEVKKIKKIIYFRSVKMSGSESKVRGDLKMEVYLVR